MPVYPAHYYTRFVELAQARGSGLGKGWRRDGSLGPIAQVLRANSTDVQVRNAIAALAFPKRRKYRHALTFVENTFPIPVAQRIALLGASSEGIRYVRNATRPTANFVGGHLNHGSLVLTTSTSLDRIEQSVPDFITNNTASTRLLLIHLGGAQVDMGLNWDGMTALQHMNQTIDAARIADIHVCILRDPHNNGYGVGLPTAVNAVCPGLQHEVGQLSGARVWVADGAAHHSAFHDPNFTAWVSAAGVRDLVVMGFDADICVRGNVFGVAEEDATAAPPNVVPSMMNFVNVVTSRPLLSGGAAGTVQAFASWGDLCYMRND